MVSSRDHCEHKCRSKVCDAKENMIQKRCHLLWTKAHWKSGKPSNSKLFIQFNKMFHCIQLFWSWVVLNKFKDSNNEVSACNVSVSQKLRHQSSLNMWLSMGFLLFDWSNHLLLESSVCDTSLVKSSLKGGRGEMMLVSDRGVDMSDKGRGKKR